MAPTIVLRTILALIALSVLGGVISWLLYSPKKEKANYNKRRILCIGDSITFGAGVIYSRWKDSFPVMLENMLGKDHQVLNYGISGATLLSESDKPYSKSFLKTARKTEPEVCILMLGSNDSKPQNWNAAKYEDTLARWISELRSFPSSPTVFLVTPPAAFCVDGKPVVYAIRDDIIREEIYPIVKRQAQLHGTGLVDLYAATESHPELFVDGVHPNRLGNQVIAMQIYDVMTKNLGLKKPESMVMK